VEYMHDDSIYVTFFLKPTNHPLVNMPSRIGENRTYCKRMDFRGVVGWHGEQRNANE
jgi:hypothetical protein